MSLAAAEPVRPDRPRTVNAAFWLQIAMVGALLVLTGLAVAAAVQFDGEITRAAEAVPDADPDEVSGERFGNVFAAVTIALPAVFLAVWFALTARPVRNGGTVARTLLYVGSGLYLLTSCGWGLSGPGVRPLLFRVRRRLERDRGRRTGLDRVGVRRGALR